MLLKTLIRDRLVSFATKYCGLNELQYGAHGRMLCESAILNKILTFDIICMMQKKTAMAEFDAKANHDSMIPMLVVFAC